MEMPGQTGTAAVAAFVGMWTVMTAAMMLPSLLPLLVRYRRYVVGAGALRAGILTVMVAAGYFVVWIGIGLLAYPVSGLVGRLDPATAWVIVAVAIAYQLAPRKARDLACCRQMLACPGARDADARAAWWRGLRYGVHCARCCANLMAIPFVLGTMSLGVMLLVGAAIAAERRMGRTAGGAALPSQ